MQPISVSIVLSAILCKREEEYILLIKCFPRLQMLYDLSNSTKEHRQRQNKGKGSTQWSPGAGGRHRERLVSWREWRRGEFEDLIWRQWLEAAFKICLGRALQNQGPVWRTLPWFKDRHEEGPQCEIWTYLWPFLTFSTDTVGGTVREKCCISAFPRYSGLNGVHLCDI